MLSLFSPSTRVSSQPPSFFISSHVIVTSYWIIICVWRGLPSRPGHHFEGYYGFCHLWWQLSSILSVDVTTMSGTFCGCAPATRRMVCRGLTGRSWIEPSLHHNYFFLMTRLVRREYFPEYWVNLIPFSRYKPSKYSNARKRSRNKKPVIKNVMDMLTFQFYSSRDTSHHTLIRRRRVNSWC